MPKNHNLPKHKILIVDDRPENLYTLEQVLQKLDVVMVRATSGVEALGQTLEHDFCLAIVDVQMPEMDGYELVDLLRGNQSTATLPVIFVSAIYSDEYHHRKGYDAGAVDFLSKPFVPEILLSKVRVFLDLCDQRHELETVVEQLNAANATLARRAMQLELSAQVSHQVTSILDKDRLLASLSDLIQSQFGYYFVGIWLLNEARDGVVLQASALQFEDPALATGYTIPLDVEKSLIAHVCRTGEPYLAPDVRTEPRYMYTDKLPHTRAELTLPLCLGDQLLGALDIQSDHIAAFTSKDVRVLQALANQIAIAIRNARLYDEVVRFNEELEAQVQARTTELESAYHELELIDKNKTNFLQVVSHELRTPLTLIKGFGQMLLKHPLVKEEGNYQQQVLGITTGAERMHDIVNSMLDMVKIDSQALHLVPKPLALGDLLAVLARDLHEPLRERHLMLRLDSLDALPPIEADAEALKKLFEHLLYNAIKYTPDGGTITISGHIVGRDIDSPDQRFVEVIVSDTGIGIDPQVQELIFTKFYQVGQVAHHSSGKTKFKGGGPGLGLAIAKGIVTAHGGHIWVESPGYDEATCPGSQFHIVLPMESQIVSQEQVIRRVTDKTYPPGEGEK